jgi:hypothetical protein
MMSHSTMCFPTPWGDPVTGWPSLPPWAQPVYAAVWRPTPEIWA